jgi:hypothetical protein
MIPEYIIYIIGFISTIFLGYWGIFYFIHKKRSNWFLFGSIFFGLLVCIAMWLNSKSIEKRARIIIENATIFQMNTGKPLQIEINAINSGTVNAKQLVWKGRIKTGGTGIYKSEWDSIQASNSESKTYVAPLEQFSQICWTENVITKEDSLQIRDGIRNLSRLLYTILF